MPFRNELTLFSTVLHYRLMIYTADDQLIMHLQWFKAVVLNSAISVKHVNCEQCWPRVINALTKLPH